MKIVSENYKKTGFKKAQIVKADREVALKLLQNISQQPTSSVLENNQIELWNIFSKFFQEKINKYSSNYVSKNDYLQSLNLKFFELLNDIKEKKLFPDDFMKIIEDTGPNLNDKINQTFFLEEPVCRGSRLTYMDKLTPDFLPMYPSSRSPMELNAIKKRFSTVLNKSHLNEKEENVIKEKGSGKTLKDIASQKGVSTAAIRIKLLSGIAKIQQQNEKLPIEYKKMAQDLKMRYKLTLSVDKIIEQIIKKSYHFKYSENIFENIEKASKLLDISEKEYANMIVKFFELSIQNPETINNRVNEISKGLNISRESFIKAANFHPQILCYKPDFFKKQVLEASNLLNITQEKYIKACLTKPCLFCMKPEKIKQNIEEASILLNISQDKFIESCLKKPDTFYLKPETIYDNISRYMQITGLSKEQIVEKALKNPALIARDPKRIQKNMKINNFYQIIRGENTRTVIGFDSIEQLYKSILIYLVKKELKGQFHVNQKNFIEAINKFPNKNFHFELPEHEITEDFIQYVKDFFEKNCKNNTYTFKIKELK